MHEYSIVGHAKEKYLFWISLVSIVAAPLLTTLIGKTLSFVNFNAVTITISSGLMFSILYFASNKYIWRIGIISNIISIPDLNGVWECVGKSMKYGSTTILEWNGTITIKQTWNKIMIVLTTKDSQSMSTSLLGGIKQLSGKGYILSYMYDNQPKATEIELHKHKGFCNLVFDNRLASAEGEYYNDRDRASYGTMKLRRIGV